MASKSALGILHVEGASPPQFTLQRLADGKVAAPVTIKSPYEFAVEGQPNSNLMRQLRWYLEGFLDYPFPPETGHAERVLDALKAWGTGAFNALFDRRDPGEWLKGSGILQVRSDDALILSWPWEALFDPQTNYVAHQRRFERRLNKLSDPPTLAELPKDRVNILLVVARPYEADVRYRSIARPLVELIRKQGLAAYVEVLRPPTFDRLREHLRERPGYYHVLHFDGHGAYGDGASGYSGGSGHKYQGRKGHLIFEDAQAKPDPKSASDLSALLREHAVPAVVLNACQSGMLDESAEGAFASVATGLLQSGMRSVVAMAYSLYVSGAQEFLPAFYRRLFEAGIVAEAVRAGRQEMLAHKGRVCARGRYPLEDWLLPVLYQQEPGDFGFVKEHWQAKAPAPPAESRLPKEVREHREEYGFVGRDGPMLEMERALHRPPPAILVHSLGGVGKTTLARGFLRWLDETGGLEGALWFDFRNIHTAESVINETGQALYDEKFRLAPNRLELLRRALAERRVLMVWDNFESAATNLTGDDRAELGRFLDAIRGGRGKVIVTSRLAEEWMKPSQRFALPLRGLDGEERWEYCETILQELGLKIDRSDAALAGLMDQLAGHPLAMRVVLPKLEQMPAVKIAEALRTNIAELELSEVEATLRLFEQGLPEELRPLLALVGLHERYVTAAFLEAMAKQVDAGWTRERIDRCLAAMRVAGLVRDIGNGHYEMHPFLTSYLRRNEASEACQRAFVDVMGKLADELAPRELHEQRIPFLLHGANFHFALALAARLSMDEHFAALTRSLAAYAQTSRNFGEAARLFESLARLSRARGDEEHEGAAYHQLGNIAYEQRDFAAARELYLKSLAIQEKQGDMEGVAASYYQLGLLAKQQGDFAAARDWYVKSLAICENQDILHGVAKNYQQLGTVALEQRDFAAARDWYLKALAIDEQQGNLLGAATTYHQLGNIASEQRDFATARDWYLKSRAIEEQQGNLHGVAQNYSQLGTVALEQRDFAAALDWYLKSLAIDEQQGNLHGAAMTYGRLGHVAILQGGFEDCVGWLIRSITGLLRTKDQHNAQTVIRNFSIVYQHATPAGKLKLETIWREAGLGEFPKETSE